MRHPHVGKTKIKAYLLSLNPLENVFPPPLPPGSSLAAIFLQVSGAKRISLKRMNRPKYREKIN